MKEEQVFNIEFSEIVAAIRRKFYLVIIITIPALLLGFHFGNSSVRINYEARTTIIVGNPMNSERTQFEISEVARVQSLLGTYCAIARTVGVSEETIEKLNLDISPDKLRNGITAIPQSGTSFIELRLTWPNSQQAVIILDTLTQVYIKEATRIYPAYSMMVIEKVNSPTMIISSNKTIYTAIGLAAGLITSLLLIFALEFMNDSLRTEKDVETGLGLPVLGVIPKWKKKIREINADSLSKLDHSITEAFRTLKTNILFASFYSYVEPMMKTIYQDLKVIAVTSGMPSEGKTITASMLAVLLAKDRKKSILVDCNLRKPDVHKNFNLLETGLASTLTKGIDWNGLIHKSEIENLYILAAGMTQSNPVELLSSERMKELLDALKCSFDHIILDTPSVNIVTDAQVLSPYVDGYLLVVSSGRSRKSEAIKTKKLIQYADGKILGVVLNKSTETVPRRYYKRYCKAIAKKVEPNRKTQREKNVQCQENGEESNIPTGIEADLISDMN